jgi:hypothetical protein
MNADSTCIAGFEYQRAVTQTVVQWVLLLMQIDISFARMGVYECGATLLALLACPAKSKEAKRKELYLSLCAWALWCKYLAASDDWTPITVRPQQVFRHPDRIDSDVAFVGKRFCERMVAGRMAVPFFLRAELGDELMLPRQIRRLSLNQMAEFVLKDAGLANPENVETRFWRPSRPVIHLATAAAFIGQQLKKVGVLFSQEIFLESREFIACVLRNAEELEALIANDSQFPIKADQLIRVRVI